ncbi:MAG: hypothetical protein M1820_000484 [Bogoriella megaspora]|nr:MAG: hypothetical protein M1820_000484 [Bogoriella megaspora]
MHYIRFLKAPYIASEGNKTLLKCLITITTDLGDAFYPEEVPVTVTLRSEDPDGDIFLRKNLAWSNGMRSLPIAFDITNTDVDWPARVHICKKGSPYSDHFESHHPGSPPSIISAWSDILNPSESILEAKKLVERRFTPVSNRVISIWEETGESITRHLWDAGVVLAGFLDRVIALQQHDELRALEHALASATYKRLNVLELGCGSGIVGIAMAQTIPDCSVLLTDLPEAEELVQRNIAGMNPAMSSEVRFEPLDWEAEIPPKIRDKMLDIIVVADCTYNPDSAPDLVRTIAAFTSRSPKAIVVVSMKNRHPSESIFFELMSAANLIEASHSKVLLRDNATPVDVFVYHHKDRPPTRDEEGTSHSGSTGST